MSSTPIQREFRRPRGSVIIIVLWTIAIGALAAAATQMLAYRQATIGRQAIERVQARWAARGGVEHTIAIMAYHTQYPLTDDAFAIVRDMELADTGEMIGAGYTIRHYYDGQEWGGPMDEHSKANINHELITSGLLMLLFDDMTVDVADAISDWRDDDDDAGMMGVEEDYYQSLNPPYNPRNGNLRSIHELELVAGVFPDHLRGEDWNLNSRLDPNESDGARTLPYDNLDDILEPGWAGWLTAYSVDNLPSASGLPRIYLRRAEVDELVDRLGVSDAQAASLIYFGRNPENRLEQLETIALNQVDDAGNVSQNIINPPCQPLDEEQLQACLDELTIHDPLNRPPGRMNINTVPRELLRRLMEALGADEYITDEIIFLRDSSPTGIVSVFDLREVPGMNEQLWDQMIRLFTTRSTIYSINSRGRSHASGREVEISVVVDRSTLPVKILEYREQ